MKKSAFSLIELTIVLIVIGVLVVGVSQGGVMINTARLSNARAITADSPVKSIDGLIAWYETSTKNSFLQSETTDKFQISEWRDISPGSILKSRNTLTGPSSDAVIYRTKGINGIPSVQFDGTNRLRLEEFYQGSLSQVTAFIVLKLGITLSTSSIDVIFDAYDNTTSKLLLALKEDSVRIDAGSAEDTATTPNPATINDGDTVIIAAYFNGSSSAAYVNNANDMAGDGTVNPGTNKLNGISVGANRNNVNRFYGMISELILFNRPLKRGDRIDVLRYLSQKYKIEVADI